MVMNSNGIKSKKKYFLKNFYVFLKSNSQVLKFFYVSDSTIKTTKNENPAIRTFVLSCIH